ncbi:hypothetical protein D3C81_2011290 [compost metagenome]
MLVFTLLPPASLTVTAVEAVCKLLAPFGEYATVGAVLSIFETVKLDCPLWFPAASFALAYTVPFVVNTIGVVYVCHVVPFVLYSFTTVSLE